MSTAKQNVEPRASGHPLELIAPFRRWPASPLRNLVYTAIWNCLIGFVLSLLQYASGSWNTPYPRMLAYTLFVSNLVGFMVHGALTVVERALPPGASRWQVRVLEVLVIGLCTVLGIVLASAVLRGVNPVDVFQSRADLWLLAIFGLVTAVFMIVVLVAGERRIARETLAARQQEQFAAAGRLVAEARLSALQAQIEPHFLYNTLANVVSLIDTRPAQAKRMLERFIDYLRASLAVSRAGDATVGAELDLAGTYLDVLAVRLGERLRWRIDASHACRALPVAPMLIQPLVENAVMHGIEPKVEGGEIVLRASCEDGMLRIEVCDSGRGLVAAPPRPGGGVGLSNLRDRLRQMHGSGASLQLIENPTGGVTSRLLLPLQVLPSTPSAR